MMEQQLKQAVQFFRNEQAYKNLFTLFRKKYESLGRIGGTVPVTEFTGAELKVIGRFFGVPSDQLHVKGSVSLHIFEQQLANTRFHEIGLKQLLDAYFGEIIISKKQQQKERDEKLRSLLLEQQIRHPELKFWFNFLFDIRGEGRWIIRLVEKDPAYFEQLIASLSQAISTLPAKAERLPMFSQRITGDPHAFDLDKDLGKMFLHVLSVDRSDDQTETSVLVPTHTEAVNELLNEYHIYRDDLLNFVTSAGLYAETVDGMQKVWKSAVKQNTVQIVPLRELVPLTRVYPASGNKVRIVENSGVCSVLLDKEPRTPIICTNGQFTLAALILLDLLVEEGCLLYYAGDFDPEGLSMAQRLLERYPDNMRLWHMSEQAYKVSGPVLELSKDRLKKLNGISHEELIDVAQEMRSVGKAGYQEALVDLMLADLELKD